MRSIRPIRGVRNLSERKELGMLFSRTERSQLARHHKSLARRPSCLGPIDARVLEPAGGSAHGVRYPCRMASSSRCDLPTHPIHRKRAHGTAACTFLFPQKLAIGRPVRPHLPSGESACCASADHHTYRKHPKKPSRPTHMAWGRQELDSPQFCIAALVREVHRTACRRSLAQSPLDDSDHAGPHHTSQSIYSKGSSR